MIVFEDVVVNNKRAPMFPKGSAELSCTHTHQCIHLCQSSFMPNGVLLGTSTSARGRVLGSGLPCILHCLFMHLGQYMYGASIGKPV